MYSYKVTGQSATDIATKPLAERERERALWIASGEYMRGHLTKKQLEASERLYAPHLFSLESPPRRTTRKPSLWNRCKEAILELADQ